jgi:hypothetical protein
MANRNDNAPKQFRQIPCSRCGGNFQSTGPSAKRCDPCKIEHKREYERENKRARHSRNASCTRCGTLFETEQHAHRKYCEPCIVVVRNEASIARYDANVERGRAIGRRSYEKNKDALLAQRKTPEARAVIAATEKARRDRNPGLRLHCNVSRIMSLSLNGKKAGRSWQSLVGYTLDALKRHLERQFLKGMSWENYGTAWHVDHRVPRASFTFSDANDPEFKACWALTNLQPLWAADNLKKSAKRSTLI